MRPNLFLLALLGAILVLSPISNAVTDGRITNVSWPSKSTYYLHESVPFQVTIKNTGTEMHSFWVGYSVQDASGRRWWEPEVAQQTAYIEPEGNSSIGLSWNPRSDASRGAFVATVILWEGWNNGLPQGELDRKTKTEAFQLNSSLGFKNDVILLNMTKCCQ
jgi:hypothetical protein